jgi:23S rRNA (uracil1939-C5)-methyltransferase
VTGEAFGRDEDGRVIFVADAIPGETVEVEIIAEEKGWRRGILRRLVKPSPDRVEAPCPHFGLSQPVEMADGGILNRSWRLAGCAGCQWQQIDYERQLALKREIVVNILARDGRLGKTRKQSRQIAEQLVAEVIALGAHEEDSFNGAPAVLDFGFRTQMRFDFAQSEQLTLAGRDGEHVAIDACPLHHPQLAELFAGFRNDRNGEDRAEEEELTPESGIPAVASVTLAVGGTADSLSETAKGVLLLHSDRDDPPSLEIELPVNVFLLHEGDEPSLELLVGDWSYSVQVEGRQLTAYPSVGDGVRSGHLLAEEVVAAVAAEMLELKTFEHLLELWAGIGARAVILADQAATIVAVEEAELLAAALRANLDGLDNADPWLGEMLPTIRKLRRGEYRFDAVLLSPPDGVIEPELFSLLTRMRIRRCALVTDEPSRLARALADVDEAGYRLSAVQPIDLQPHQPGVTLVARFDRK